jgi:hypothetical protein
MLIKGHGPDFKLECRQATVAQKRLFKLQIANFNLEPIIAVQTPATQLQQQYKNTIFL